MEIWTAFPGGIIIAMIVSCVGIGGGILWMPFLLLWLKLSPETAVVTSLMIQTAGTGSGSYAFIRQKKIDLRFAGFLLTIAVPGIALGAFMANHLNPDYIELILGVLVLTTAFLFVSSTQKYADTGIDRINLKQARRYSWIAVLVSFGSGMLSTGIGEWMIPVMRSRLSLKMSAAIATCIFITFGICVIGVGFHLILGANPNFTVIAWAVPGVIIGGQIGPRLIERINERMLKEVFVFILTLIGIHLIYNSF